MKSVLLIGQSNMAGRDFYMKFPLFMMKEYGC